MVSAQLHDTIWQNEPFKTLWILKSTSNHLKYVDVYILSLYILVECVYIIVNSVIISIDTSMLSSFILSLHCWHQFLYRIYFGKSLIVNVYMNVGTFCLVCYCPVCVNIGRLRLFVVQYTVYGSKLSHFASPVDGTSLIVDKPQANSNVERLIND
jgi:hypothetical protein